MRIASSFGILLTCGAILAGRAGAQPVVVAELRVTAASLLERSATIGSPAALRGLENLWVDAVRHRFGYVNWKHAAEAPASTPRLILVLSEEPSRGCLPGRLKMTLEIGNAAASDWNPGAGGEELKADCDSDWQEETIDEFAGDFKKWIDFVPFSPNSVEWIEANLLRKVDLVSGIVAADEHLFLPVSPRSLGASGDSLIKVQFGRDPIDGTLWGRPCPGQGDRTQVMVAAFNCKDIASGTDIRPDQLGTGVVWHPLLQSVLLRCQSPVAFMWHYVADFGVRVAPPGPGASSLPAGGTVLDPDGGR